MQIQQFSSGGKLLLWIHIAILAAEEGGWAGARGGAAPCLLVGPSDVPRLGLRGRCSSSQGHCRRATSSRQ